MKTAISLRLVGRSIVDGLAMLHLIDDETQTLYRVSLTPTKAARSGEWLVMAADQLGVTGAVEREPVAEDSVA